MTYDSDVIKVNDAIYNGESIDARLRAVMDWASDVFVPITVRETCGKQNLGIYDAGTVAGTGEMYTSNGLDYRGKQTKTRTGKTCK